MSNVQYYYKKQYSSDLWPLSVKAKRNRVMFVMLLECVSTPEKLEKYPGIFFKLSRCGYTLRVTSQTSYSPEYTIEIVLY